MSRFVRTLYRWAGGAGEGKLERAGRISEARLRAWEYERSADGAIPYAAGAFQDTVRTWRTHRPDLEVPEQLLVGDREEREAES